MRSELYFRHDLYTLEDSKVMALVYRYHELGYGVFWAMVEKLTAEPEHRMPMQVLAMQVAMKLASQKPSKVVEVLNFCKELGLLKDEDGLVCNERILRQCEEVERRSATQRENVNKRWEKYRSNTAEAQPNNDGNTTVSERREERAVSDKAKAEWLVARYHELCPSLPKVRTITDARVTHSRTLLTTYGAEVIDEAFRKAEASDFLKHGSGTWTGASFDWLLNKTNFAKVIEGNYDNRHRSSICNDSEVMANSQNADGGFDL